MSRSGSDHAKHGPVVTGDIVPSIGVSAEDPGLPRDERQHGPAEPRQAHARLAIGEVTADEREIRIGGSKAVFARCAAELPGEAPPAVLSIVQEWRAAPGEDENYVYSIAL